MKYQKELNLSVGLCRHSLATNGLQLGVCGGNLAQNLIEALKFNLAQMSNRSRLPAITPNCLLAVRCLFS